MTSPIDLGLAAGPGGGRAETFVTWVLLPTDERLFGRRPRCVLGFEGAFEARGRHGTAATFARV
jgi:hypothetical protein